MRPRLGLIVQYRMMTLTSPMAAIVTKVLEDDAVHLIVFDTTEPHGVTTVLGVPYSATDEAGCWSYLDADD